ncbi:hypothetical protein ACFDR9_000934 [Janthinobacterium sp. CG_23.3]|uniref:hypothetical protein n=1 Tax=unclassified Janthinobacterium TaxID=2610881 RepID=UPI0012FA88DE|nr:MULTISPECIES: hypothetical protein [unclassified Janthinobacterium]MEC5161630.1 hypothetical protein [Janthinobacterium sp. CG_S6]
MNMRIPQAGGARQFAPALRADKAAAARFATVDHGVTRAHRFLPEHRHAVTAAVRMD